MNPHRIVGERLEFRIEYLTRRLSKERHYSLQRLILMQALSEAKEQLRVHRLETDRRADAIPGGSTSPGSLERTGC